MNDSYVAAKSSKKCCGSENLRLNDWKIKGVYDCETVQNFKRLELKSIELILCCLWVYKKNSSAI